VPCTPCMQILEDEICFATRYHIAKHVQEECARVYGSQICVHDGMSLVGGSVSTGELRFERADGSQMLVDADLVIGADGSNSVTRNLLLSEVCTCSHTGCTSSHRAGTPCRRATGSRECGRHGSGNECNLCKSLALRRACMRARALQTCRTRASARAC
jgi:hypothetical protein